MGRIGRSFALVGQSYRVLMQDKELMILPLISGAVMAAIVAVLALSTDFNGLGNRDVPPVAYVPVFLTYVVLYAVGIFFQCAVVAGAAERMRGGDPTVSSALRAAAGKITAIVLWAVIAATVGMVLRAVQDRAGFLGKLVVGLLGAAWSLATFFVVPVLVLEDVSIADVFGRSVALFKNTWGETVTGGVSLGIAAVCAWVTLIAATGLLAWAVGTPALVFFAGGAVVLMMFFSALQGVYVASLYLYATNGSVPNGFDASTMQAAFVQKP